MEAGDGTWIIDSLVVRPIVTLAAPTSAGENDTRDLSALEKGHVVVNHFQKSEHFISLDDLKHPANRWNLNVVNQKQSPGLDLGVEIEILKVWEGICMRSVNQSEL